MITTKIIQIANQDLATDLAEKFNGLFPAWTTILATILAFLILMLVLTKWVWNPIKKMVKDRKDYIQGNIDSANQQNKEAKIANENASNELIDSRIQAASIITEAKIVAEQIKADAQIEATNQAKRIVSDAKEDIEHQKIVLEQDTRNEIIEVALAAAKQIVEKEVDTKTNRKLVKEFIAKESK